MLSQVGEGWVRCCSIRSLSERRAWCAAISMSKPILVDESRDGEIRVSGSPNALRHRRRLTSSSISRPSALAMRASTRTALRVRSRNSWLSRDFLSKRPEQSTDHGVFAPEASTRHIRRKR